MRAGIEGLAGFKHAPCAARKSDYTDCHEFCFGNFGLLGDWRYFRRVHPAAGRGQAAVVHRDTNGFCPRFRQAGLPDAALEAAVLLGFGFVFAQSQAAAGMLLRSASPKRQNSSLPNGYNISSKALTFIASAAAISVSLP
jgi:hypothetical protein